jgi:hypothetical protein
MAITIAYWRPLFFKHYGTVETRLANITQFALEKQLPPLQWVEEYVSMDVHWCNRSLGKALSLTDKGDYLLVDRLLNLSKTVDECCDILAFLAERELFFYDLNSQLCIEHDEQFAQWQHALTVLDDFLVNTNLPPPVSAPRDMDSEISEILEAYRDEILFLLQHGATQTFVAQRYSVSPAKLSAWLRQSS